MTPCAQSIPLWAWALCALAVGWLIHAALDRAQLARQVLQLQARLAEARAARLDLLVRLDVAAGSAAVMRRQRDAVVEAAAGAAKLASLDALRPAASATETATAGRGHL